jgi:hypothetical protein
MTLTRAVVVVKVKVRAAKVEQWIAEREEVEGIEAEGIEIEGTVAAEGDSDGGRDGERGTERTDDSKKKAH